MRRNLIFLTVVVILGLCLGSLSFVTSANFNNVTVNIQTSSIQADYFVVNAYNMTGYLESSTQTHYPAASFELPNGQYIFTVTANNESIYYPVPLAASSGAVTSPGAPSLPVYIAPAAEYGFSVQQVSGSMSLTITTQNVSQYPTNSLAVKVVYDNGTAAVGASVSASVIGSSYYWGYEPNVVTWATTGDDGVATLVTPTAPVQINVWIWVSSDTTSYPTPKLGVPGQVVNGTVIAYPIYIGLAGSALLVPPQTSVTVTLQAQQPNYWVTPYAGTASPSGTTSSSSGYAAGPGSVPASVYTQQQGSPNLQNFQAPTSTASPQPTASPTSSTNGSGNVVGGSVFLLILVLVAVVIVVVVVILTLIMRNKRKISETS